MARAAKGKDVKIPEHEETSDGIVKPTNKSARLMGQKATVAAPHGCDYLLLRLV